ncbi:MAG: 2-oxoacid:acceptor oxidoreductase subunit alpha [Gemmatimonadetes bacterium]|nr:2-oxoacid:acceptor oxidoreductase subunit alpha [Gemmatimonadota bacterium]
MNRVNDFAFKSATVNGTGSASANSLLMEAIFRMGIPVTGKNIFPSNIQGLPTWYEVRVSRDGFTARPPTIDLVVALNPATYAQDIASVCSGGYVLYDSSWPLDAKLVREDVTILGVPLGAMCREAFTRDRDRTLLRNIAYAGALAALLQIDMGVIETMLNEKFARKKGLLDANHRALRLGYDYAQKHFSCPLPIHCAPMNETSGSILIDGNTACALGALYAGATVGAWYPITPSTSLMDAFKEFCQEFRIEPETGLHRYCIVQAEDELSAAGMVIGAGWMGARAFTCTSGPGISLMQEFLGFAYYTEIPGVWINVQRAGPATGLPTRTQQADLMSMAYASHGDTKHIVLFPADPAECFTLTVEAFNAAERFQTPVFVASDLDIGMNDWMVPRLQWDDSYRPDRGKVLDVAELEQAKKFFRYLDTDGDGVAARTLPGVSGKGAYFVRGSGHDKFGAYTEDGAAYREVVDRLTRKFETAARELPKPVVIEQEGADVGILLVGSSDCAVREAVVHLHEQGIVADSMRIRSFPFAPEVKAFIDRYRTVFVVEQNRDAQLRSLLAIETGTPRDRMISVLEYAGQPITAGALVTTIASHLAGVSA